MEVCIFLFVVVFNYTAVDNPLTRGGVNNGRKVSALAGASTNPVHMHTSTSAVAEG